MTKDYPKQKNKGQQETSISSDVAEVAEESSDGVDVLAVTIGNPGEEWILGSGLFLPYMSQ